MTEEIKLDNKQDNTSSNTVCCCRSFFTKLTFSKLLLGFAIIFTSYFVYNKVNEWLTYYKIEKITKNIAFEFDPFDGISINYPGRFSALDSIDNKTLLYALIKQQAEIIKHQKCIEESLARLINTTPPTSIKDLKDSKAANTNQPANPMLEKQPLPEVKPEQSKGAEQPQGQPTKNN